MAAANHRTRGSERSDAVSDTPRTDDMVDQNGLSCQCAELPTCLARQLERELSAVTAERDALKADRETELFQMAGYLSAELPALHSVEGGEIMRAVDSWIKREAKYSELARND